MLWMFAGTVCLQKSVRIPPLGVCKVFYLWSWQITFYTYSYAVGVKVYLRSCIFRVTLFLMCCLKCLVITNTVSSFLKKLMLHLISPSGILTNVCLGTTRTLRWSSFFLFFVFLVYYTALLLVFLSWTNKRIIVGFCLRTNALSEMKPRLLCMASE